jgi:hypothetical protein
MLRIRLSSKAQHSSRRTRRLRIGDYVVDRATARACGSGFAAAHPVVVFGWAIQLRGMFDAALSFLIRQSYAVPVVSARVEDYVDFGITR